MTVREFIESRDTSTFGKKIRVLNSVTHKNLGDWTTCQNLHVTDTKVTEKYLFIFVLTK